jgi:hypothetical protein
VKNTEVNQAEKQSEMKGKTVGSREIVEHWLLERPPANESADPLRNAISDWVPTPFIWNNEATLT